MTGNQSKRESARAKPRTATTKQKAPSRIRKSLTLGQKILMSVAVLAVLVIVVTLAVNITQKISAQNQIEAYLEDKYQADFIVSLPTREANGFGVEGYFQSEVFPEGRSDLTFQARTSSGGTSDNYPTALWKEQEKPLLESQLKEIFGYLPPYDLEIHSMNTFNDRISGSDIPSISEVGAMYPGELPYTLRIKSETPFNGAFKDESAEKLLKVIEYARSKNGSLTIQFIYYDPKANTNSGWSLDSIELGESRKINNVEDVINQFETWRAR